jgi:Na+/H+ antiporter NhaD/arsenite permease-like protein
LQPPRTPMMPAALSHAAAGTAATGIGAGTGAADWDPPLYWVVPFVLMVLSVAVLPIAAHGWWGRNRNRLLVSGLLGVPVVAFAALSAPNRLWNTVEEYIAFVVLLGSLYVISGGVLITGNLQARPLVNTAFLLAGTVLASLVGTTGASMLLIRPLLATNSERRHRVHTVVFFVFLVSNIGGCLTPLGDPPLFMGYLKGVPFAWTFQLWPEWALLNGVLLLLYLALDVVLHRRESAPALRADAWRERPLVVRGAHNLLFLGGVVAAVALRLPFPLRELVLVGCAAASWFTTRPQLRKTNRFTFAPILEVVVVFAGIFATMIPALAVLEAHGRSLGVVTPMQFFWATGALSSFLDNAPTYLAFYAAAGAELPYPQWVLDQGVLTLEGQHRIPDLVLEAISLGAVFMGANTYIGNGPNFMVRAIAEEQGVRMPSFFGYMAWAAAILLPLFGVMSLWFFAAP